MDITRICAMQRAYFEKGETKNVGFRIAQLKKLQVAIRAQEKLLLDALQADLGKSGFEGYMSEVGMVLEELAYMLRHVRRFARARAVPTPLAQGIAASRVLAKPYGNVLIMSPWNYPLLLTIGPLVDALAAGNTAVVKPSAYSPNVSHAIAKLLGDTFAPEYVAVIEGGRNENTALLEEKFDYIFFTGGKKAGKEIYMKAAETLTPVTLELGGKSPAILTDMIPMEIAAKRIIFGKFLNAGQTCVAPDYILIKDSMKAAFIDYADEYIKKFFGEHPLESENLCKIINKDQFDRLKKLLENQDILIGGEVDEEHLKIAPTIVNDVDFDNPLMEEEIFGPILPLVEYNRIEEAIQYINSHDKPLALYLFSNDSYHANKILDLCSFGDACINDTVSHFATNTLPFGGVGASGIGYYHGKFTFETFSHRRSVLHKSTRIDLPFRYYPLTDDKMKWIKRFLK